MTSNTVSCTQIPSDTTYSIAQSPTSLGHANRRAGRMGLLLVKNNLWLKRFLQPIPIEWAVKTMCENALVENQNHPPTASPDVTRNERLESEFLAIISHELRSPLAAIKGYAATLRRHGHKLGRAERDEFLQAIDEASDRLEVLIERLMTLSHLEAGTQTLHLAPVNMVHLVREAIAAAQYRWGMGTTGKGTHVFIGPEQETMPLVLADLRLQREVLDIVLENAVKYSPHGGVIRVELQTGDRMLTTRVSDTGIGIPPEHLHRIFDRFHQVDQRLTREVEGAGLGLAICKRSMELQGGAIWAESEPGIGSIFSMTLPLAEPLDEWII